MTKTEIEMTKYSWERIEENKFYIWHTEYDMTAHNGRGQEIKTLIAITDTAEKAHFLAGAANAWHIINLDKSPQP